MTENELTQNLEKKVEKENNGNGDWRNDFNLLILKPYEEGIRLRFGAEWNWTIPYINLSIKSSKLKSGYPKLIIPIFHQYRIVDKRTIEEDLPIQNVITKDNVEIGVDGVIYYKVIDARKAILEVVDYKESTKDFASSKLKEEVGRLSLDEVVRTQLNEESLGPYKKENYKLLESFGTEISKIMIKQVNLPDELRDSMARYKISLEEARGKEELSKIETNVAKNLEEAAKIYKENPQALAIRYLQALENIAEKNKSTIILPGSISSLAEKLTG